MSKVKKLTTNQLKEECLNIELCDINIEDLEVPSKEEVIQHHIDMQEYDKAVRAWVDRQNKTTMK